MFAHSKMLMHTVICSQKPMCKKTTAWTFFCNFFPQCCDVGAKSDKSSDEIRCTVGLCHLTPNWCRFVAPVLMVWCKKPHEIQLVTSLARLPVAYKNTTKVKCSGTDTEQYWILKRLNINNHKPKNFMLTSKRITAGQLRHIPWL